MSMTPPYEQLYQTAKELEHHVHDATDDHHNQDAQQLERQIIALEDDLEVNRNPRDIENRLKQIQSLLDRSRHQAVFMSMPDAEHFYRECEQLRMTVRKFPNY